MAMNPMQPDFGGKPVEASNAGPFGQPTSQGPGPVQGVIGRLLPGSTNVGVIGGQPSMPQAAPPLGGQAGVGGLAQIGQRIQDSQRAQNEMNNINQFKAGLGSGEASYSPPNYATPTASNFYGR